MSHPHAPAPSRGRITAAPCAREILEGTLRYLNVQPVYTAEEKARNSSTKATVPDVTGESFSDAAGILGGCGLDYIVSPPLADGSDFIVLDQYPKPGEEVDKDEVIYLYRE